MEELRNNLISLCNQSGLPIEAIYFVVKDVYRDVIDAFTQYKNQNNTIEENKEETENDN